MGSPPFPAVGGIAEFKGKWDQSNWGVGGGGGTAIPVCMGKPQGLSVTGPNEWELIALTSISSRLEKRDAKGTPRTEALQKWNTSPHLGILIW